MILNPDRAVLEDLSQNSHSRWVTWLRESLERTRRENDTLEGRDLTVSQGQAQLLSQLLEYVDRSEDFLNNFIRNENLEGKP